jgi:hypothetical protein
MIDPEIEILKDIVFDQLAVNTCCDQDCISCILDAQCQTESNCKCSKNGNPITNPDDPSNCFCGSCPDVPLTDPQWNTIVTCNKPHCNAETKTLKEWCWSCGPHQLKKEYWDDAQWHCGLDPNSPCCELANFNWEDMCHNQLDCETQKRISRLAAQCYWRKYTRNGSCQCAGECDSEDCGVNTECPDKCYTCEQLIRMHNGGAGWCHAGGAAKKQMDKYVKTTCEFLCADSPGCAACMGCECEVGDVIQVQKRE